ncbi:hypothetical protein GAN17_13635 [Mycobacterium kubicae]|nr:hypothetical protein GAN17_13635 [Mycobacterium kubicae]
MTIVANEAGANVIYLQSHPLWAAAQRRERQLQAAMRRHPSFVGRQRAAMAGELRAGGRDFSGYSSADAPA